MNFMKMTDKKFVFLLSTLALITILNCADYEKRLERIQSGDEELNIILISVDTLRADHLSSYGYDIDTPNIQRLADEGTLFTDASTPVPITLPAHASLLTGKYPTRLSLHINHQYLADEGNITIAEILQENRYKTAAFIGATPLDDIFGFNQGFDNFDDTDINTKETSDHGGILKELRGEIVMERAVDWMVDNKDDKFFTFIHLYDPHSPYSPPSSYKKRYQENPYDGEIAYVDDVLGDMFATLEDEGCLENTLIIFVSDHGEAFGEHDEVEHGIFIYEPTIHIPMIFWCPGLIPEDKRIEGKVSLIDVAPTILNILDIPLPDEIEGRSLVSVLIGDENLKTTPHLLETFFSYYGFGWSKIFGLETDEWKYILAPKPELYNLLKDPDELDNVYDEHPDIVIELDEELSELLTKSKSGSVGDPTLARIDETTERSLKSLGYISGGEPTTEQSDVNPKDRIEYITRFFEIMQSVSLGKKMYSEEEFLQLVDMAPDNYTSYKMVGDYYSSQGKLDKSIDYYEMALERAPYDAVIKISLSQAYFRINDFERSERMLNTIIESETNDITHIISAYEALAILYGVGYKDNAKAVEYLEKLLTLDSSNTKALFNLAMTYFHEFKDYTRGREYARRYLKYSPEGAKADALRKIL